MHAQSQCVCVCVCPPLYCTLHIYAALMAHSCLLPPPADRLQSLLQDVQRPCFLFLAECELFCWMNQEWSRGAQGGVGWGGASFLWRTADSPVGNSADASQTRAKLEKWIWPFPMWETKKKKIYEWSSTSIATLVIFPPGNFPKTDTNQRGLFIIILLCNYAIWIMGPTN